MKITIDSMYRSVFASLAGAVLANDEIEALIVAKFPTVHVPSLNIPDHAPSAKQSKQYALHCFARISGGYKVLPVSQWVEKPSESTGRRNGRTQEEALASALAKVKALTKPAPQANVTPANTALPSIAATANGEANPMQAKPVSK